MLTSESPAATTEDRLLTPSEVATMFRVNTKTVARWSRDGRLPAVRTLGGHRRYWRSEVLAALQSGDITTVG
jgi:excisionase family DNA binding protein